MSHSIKNNHIVYALSTIEEHFIQEAFATLNINASLVEMIEQVAQKFVASLTPEAIGRFNGRLERGLELARKGSVAPLNDPAHPRRYQVRSSDGSKLYMVDLDAKMCACPDSYKGHICKHRISAYYYEQAQMHQQQSAPVPLPQKPAFKPPSYPIKPTCSVPPPTQPRVKPTCSVPPTRAEFERAGLRNHPNPVIAVQAKPQEEAKPVQSPEPKPPLEEKPIQAPQPDVPAGRKIPETADEILAQLGYGPTPKRVQEQAVQLGTRNHRFLHGSDLNGQPIKVTIEDLTREKVVPYPGQPPVEKLCLWVSGLPSGITTGILFGMRGEDDLLAIFGHSDLEGLKGKGVVIYPKPMNIAGQSKISIRFRGVL